MSETLVCRASELNDGERRLVQVGSLEIGVFKEKGQFYAYLNRCPHQYGPACEGLLIAKVEERLEIDGTSLGMYFSDAHTHFVCPWHGYEFDLQTGVCASNPKLRVRKYDVVQNGPDLYVVT